MESLCTPQAIDRLVQDVGSPEAGCNPDTSVTSSPCSSSSITSTTQIVNYGTNMNRDFAIHDQLEGKLGREVEHEELKAAIASFRLVHGQLPSIRQLTLELESSKGEGHSSGRDDPDSSYGDLRPTTSSCMTICDGVSSPYAVRDDAIYYCPLRALRGSFLGLLSHDPVSSRLRSPGSRPQQSPSRFLLMNSPAARMPLDSHCEVMPPSAESARTPQPSRLPRGCKPNTSVRGEGNVMAADVLVQQPAPRPFVPGLNLRGVAKDASSTQVGTSTPTASPAPYLRTPTAGGDSDQHASDRGSPSEILRMLLPSACKPRTSTNAGASARGGRSSEGLRAQPGHVSPEHVRLTVATVGAIPSFDVASTKTTECEVECRDVRQPGFLRLSMDDLDQHQTGLQWMTPLKAMPAACDASTNVSSPEMVRHKPTPNTQCNTTDKTPRARSRCHYPHSTFDSFVEHEPLAAVSGSSGSGGLSSGTAKRQLLLTPERPGDFEAATPRREDAPVMDSDLQKDTPSKDPAAVARMTVEDAAATTTHQHLQLSLPSWPSPQQGLLTAAADGSDAPLVPPLRLPTPCAAGSMPATGAAWLSARCQPWSASLAPLAALPPRVPPLPLALSGSGSGFNAQEAMGGGRMNPLSVCLPSAMVYSEGPLSTRRMAAAANEGITSHALCTVFWAESEGDPDDCTDSDSQATTELEDDMDELQELTLPYGLPYTVEQREVWSATNGAVAPFPPSPLPRSPGPALTPVDNSGSYTRQVTRGRRGGRRRRDDADNDDLDCYGNGLMLPEHLWDAWERLSDGPTSRHRSLLESLTHVERITCTSYSTVSKACYQGQPVVVKIYDVAERDRLANAFAEIGVLLHLAGWTGAVRLLDYGRHEDKVMLMLESCDQSLKDWCDSQRFEAAPTSDYILECLRLWCTLAELLTELHEHWHVAHCDIKPGNVLLSSGRLRLADFSEGILFNEMPLLQDQARGTVPYQPPEMVHGYCVDARKADVWAMGCMLYEMITGEVLFRFNNGCMRAVAAGPAATAARLRNHAKYLSRRGGGSRASARAARNQEPVLPQRPPEIAEHAGGSSRTMPLCQSSLLPWDVVRASVEQAALAKVEDGVSRGAWRLAHGLETGCEAAAVETVQVVAPAQSPCVPRLPLAFTRGSGVAGSPWLPMDAVTTAAACYLPSLTLPPNFFMSAGGGSAMVTGRSLELIAEGCSAEDAFSLTSDPWVPNTAPTTARSTALSPLPLDNDTARSVASTSTTAPGGVGFCWPPAPPPSTGTARSVADSEWTLAVTTTTTAPTTTTAVGYSSGGSRPCFGPLSNRSAGGPLYHCSGGGASRIGDSEHADAAVAVPLLPPHRRLRHSVATQCADPAGPDWLTTEEADRLRIMCDEPPSFVLAHYHGDFIAYGDTATAAATEVANQSERNSDRGMAAVAAELRKHYKPRSLSGAPGPSLCDDVLHLLQTLLVEDHARPSMRQVAALATGVLQRHGPPVPSLASSVPVQSGKSTRTPVPRTSCCLHSNDLIDACELDIMTGGAGPRVDSCASMAAAMHNSWDLGASGVTRPPVLGPDLSTNACGSKGAACGGAQGPALLPRLCLAALQGQQQSSQQDDDGTVSHETAARGSGEACADPSNAGTDSGGSWADTNSMGDEPGAAVDTCGSAMSADSCTAASVDRPGAPSMSLFEASQPLLTARGSRLNPQRWLRVFTKK